MNESPAITLLDRVEALVKDHRWSKRRAREKAADVLGREEVPALDELPDEDLRELIAAWEPVNVEADCERGGPGS